jgi:integrase
MPQPAVKRAKVRDKVVAIPVKKNGWDKAIELFLEECRRRNNSASTRENYNWYLTGARMTAFIEDQGITSPAQMDKAMLEKFEGELFAVKSTVDGGKPLSAGTIHTFHRILKNFLRWAQENGHGGDEKVWTGGQKGHGLSAPKLPQKEKPHYSDAEIMTLRKHLKDRPRDLMLVNFMLGTGLRLAEVCAVTLADISEVPSHDENGKQIIAMVVKVRQGKGRKDRHVPVGGKLFPELAGQVRRFIKDREAGTLFLTERKDGGDYLPLSTNAIQTLFKRLSEDTGIHVNPHKFRHTLGFQMARAGTPIKVMMAVFGHTTPAMSLEYVSYDTDDILAAWN